MDESQLMGLILTYLLSLLSQLIEHAVNNISRVVTKDEVIAVTLENILSCLSCSSDLGQHLGELLFFQQLSLELSTVGQDGDALCLSPGFSDDGLAFLRE